MDRIVKAPAPARVGAYRVTFAPGARTAWHTHPLGQTLHVLMGVGRVQCRGDTLRVLRPGDTVWIPPGEEHWHGAAPDAAMVHIAFQEADAEGREAGWLEQVTDADYLAAPAA
jgi:quercetin dioxygenase-like cupin family protein